MLEMNGTRGVRSGARAISGANSFSAEAIRPVWYAPPTGSARARNAPRLRASSSTAATAAGAPEMTACRAELMLATSTGLPGSLWSAHRSTTTSIGSPTMAPIAPGWARAAAAIERPRTATRSSATGQSRQPAATRAEYSPRL